jgi:hypothetical protein
VKQIIYFLLSLILFSCQEKKEDIVKNVQEKPKLSIAKQHTATTNIKSVYQKEIEDWQELKTVNFFLKKFKKVSPNEALSNALELRDLVKSLKDSVKPAIFNIPAFNARVNVLENETLRLADLTLIPAITSEEVNLQIDKTIAAFSTVNSKINAILSKKEFLEAIDINIDYIGIDSTMMDSVSTKTINLKKEEDIKKLEQKKEGPPIRRRVLKKNN